MVVGVIGTAGTTQGIVGTRRDLVTVIATILRRQERACPVMEVIVK